MPSFVKKLQSQTPVTEVLNVTLTPAQQVKVEETLKAAASGPITHLEPGTLTLGEASISPVTAEKISSNSVPATIPAGAITSNILSNAVTADAIKLHSITTKAPAGLADPSAWYLKDALDVLAKHLPLSYIAVDITQSAGSLATFSLKLESQIFPSSTGAIGVVQDWVLEKAKKP